MEYTKGQRLAMKEIIEWLGTDSKVFRLAGLSGTGKTFVLSEIYRLFNKPEDIVFLAPTGRAAANLSMRGVPAVTIHSFIYNLDQTSQAKLKFDLKESIPENVSIIVVDESSMLTIDMYNDILSFGKKTIFCGDPGQLPAIGVDSHCLRNADITLTEIVRQAKDNPIVSLAVGLYNGERLKYGTFGGSVAIGSRDGVGIGTMLRADQIIVATNQERQRINKLIRDYHKRFDPIPEPGDKLVCTRNIWNTTVGGVPIINGMIGYCEKIRMRSLDTALIQFRPEHTTESVVLEMDCLPFIGRHRKVMTDLAQFDFGNAITLHKAQGSEWNNVLVVRDTVLPKVPEKVWLYTAMTRAKEKLVLAV